jgi:prepilin-type N-terminal cleavage/methylation domain-containing protein/prepilin-type processing-associated H-X9-DG protein
MHFRPRASAARRRRAAFTLVELLVVIGIIAVLISILLPTLARARESAYRTQCMSNLRQLSMAFNIYFNQNQLRFPRVAPLQAGFRKHRDEDWIYWQKNSGLDIRQSAILRLLRSNAGGGDVESICRCPSDMTWNNRPLAKDADGSSFQYSYTMNNRMNFQLELSFMPRDAAGNPLPYATKITQVRRPAEKILLFEEDEVLLDDGAANMGSNANLLAIRHDRQRIYPDGKNINRDRRGNVMFCDGHVDYVPRSMVQDPNDWCTDPSK